MQMLLSLLPSVTHYHPFSLSPSFTLTVPPSQSHPLSLEVNLCSPIIFPSLSVFLISIRQHRQCQESVSVTLIPLLIHEAPLVPKNPAKGKLRSERESIHSWYKLRLKRRREAGLCLFCLFFLKEKKPLSLHQAEQLLSVVWINMLNQGISEESWKVTLKATGSSL